MTRIRPARSVPGSARAAARGWASLAIALAACTGAKRAPICVPGDACTPANPCKVGTTSCDATLACAETDAGLPDGTSCGTNQVCAAGACIACTEGASCIPAANPCHKGVVNCATGAPLCTDTLAVGDDGAACGPDLTCKAGLCGAGDGADGAFVYSGSQPLDPARASARGAAGSTSLTVDSVAGFAAGQLLFIHQSTGANAGLYEEATIQAVGTATLVLAAPLRNTFGAGAQAVVERRFTDFTLPASATLTTVPWDGTKGGIVVFKARGAVHIDGRLTVAGLGFRGGVAGPSPSDYVTNAQGEGTSGTGPVRAGSNSAPNANGGGSGCGQGSGGGGGNGTAGSPGTFPAPGGCEAACAGTGLGQGGSAAGQADLTRAVFGGGGGASGSHGGSGRDGAVGASGGGLVFIHAGTLFVNLKLDANGANGADGYFAPLANQPVGGGGGGSGGSIRLVARSIQINGAAVTAVGGAGGASAVAGQCSPSGKGGAGGDGRIYLSAPQITGTTTPAAVKGTGP